MESGDKQLTAASQQKKIEPTFVPEWLKTAPTVVSSSSISNHVSGPFSHSDDHAAGILSRSRMPVSACELDSHRSSVITERSYLSSRRSTSTNGSILHEKDSSLHLRPYSSFSRSSRDRDRERDIEFRDREKLVNLENGFHDFPDSFMSSRFEKDTLRRSQSMVSGKRSDSWTKKNGNGTSNFQSGGSIMSSATKTSFEREFPSLGAEDKQGPPEIGRVSSPGLSSAIQNIPLGSSALIGSEGWTSALAEVPVIIGVNGPSFSPVQQATSISSISTVSSSMTGLNMAETLAQAPSRTRAAPQLSAETQKLEELAIKQSRQLIPITPSTPKTLVLNTSEKLKPKGSRNGDFLTLQKTGQQQPTVQPINQSLRGPSRPDVSKPSQVGNYHVLNREKNGIASMMGDGLNPTSSPGFLYPGVVPATSSAPSLSCSNNLKLKPDGKTIGSPVGAFMERRSVTQQNRSEFFNSIRKKSSSINTSSVPEPSSQLPALGKSDEKGTCSHSSVDIEMTSSSMSDSGLGCSDSNFTEVRSKEPASVPFSNGEKNSCLDPAEEERLLRLFGWKENAEEEEALTTEEIDAFIEEYQKLRPSSKFSRRNLRVTDAKQPE